MIYLLFVVGLFFLIKGADYLVDGSSSLARRWGVSSLVIGLTVVSFGTSAPELFVNVVSSISGNSDIAVGNIIGSNIANILLILGVTALVHPLVIKRSTVRNEIPLALLASLLLVIMASDALINFPIISYYAGDVFSGLSRIDGFIFLAFLTIFIFYTFSISTIEASDEHELKPKLYSVSQSSVMILSGIIMLVFGGNWVVDGAVSIARVIGISESFIALTVIAIGTSLPELATSIVAASKKDVDIAVGNVVGSNILNIFFVLGISSVIAPIHFSSPLINDAIFSVFVTILLLVSTFLGTRRALEKREGIYFLLIYIVYIGLIVVRG